MSIYFVILSQSDGREVNQKFRDAIEKHPASNDGWNCIRVSDSAYLIETTLPLSSIRPQIGLSTISSEDQLYIFTLHGSFVSSENQRVKQWLNDRAEQMGLDRSAR